ncbi:hypothetical protein PR048_028668 [Dryococelus australis]|uniref:Uncharacterized protein n=1 Tax=Dryococelus australis TaxID=614101 RepID=A0ABQ9GB80_9NEOP|nr:hypothetical protein PR048_028668 [Dryococelus australis]
MKSCVLAMLLAVFLLGLVRYSDALTCPLGGCPKDPGCDPAITKENCLDGAFWKYGSPCGCCPVCIPYVGKETISGASFLVHSSVKTPGASLLG